MSEGFPETGKDFEQLHDVMAHATAHIGPLRVDPARLRRAQRRRRLSEAGVVAGVLSVAVVAAAVVSQGGGGTTKTPVSPGTTSQAPRTAASSPLPSDLVTPVGISVYDSDDGSEGKGEADGLLHGTGAWLTSQYCQGFATHRGFRKSTGVIFDLGTAARLGSVTVGVGTSGASLEMWAADPSAAALPAVRADQPPAGFTKVAAATDTGTTAVLTPVQAVTTRFVLVWFTGTLPALPNPDSSIRCAHDDGHRYGDSITSVRFTRD